ncbi:hypothetical protein [Bosea sp. LC85]|uniref:hypothetical protein n=1 Tax=Bosea sp. LC85 TaxID=1502851 RepID=UPI0005B76EF7|nr:hypothetical protein [Bosea sp. LC85]
MLDIVKFQTDRPFSLRFQQHLSGRDMAQKIVVSGASIAEIRLGLKPDADPAHHHTRQSIGRCHGRSFLLRPP